MAGGGDFATGFFSAAGNKMDQTLQQHREDELARKKELTDMYNAVLQNPYSTDQQRTQAWGELQKLYPSKESKGILQKFQTLFHLGHAFNKAQQQQGGGGEMSEQTPIGGSSTQLPPGATPMGAPAAQPAKAGPTPPPQAAAMGPGYAAAAGARPGGGPTPPPGGAPPAAQTQAPPGAPPKGAGGKTQKKGTEAATSPTDLSGAVSPNITQLLNTYRKQADIQADIAASKSTARRSPNNLGEWMQAFERDNGRKPSAEEIQKFINGTKGAGQSGVKLEEAEYFRLMNEGKTEEAEAVLKKISAVRTAEKGKAPTGSSLLASIRQSIDPSASPEDRALAKKSVDEYQKLQTNVQMARGKGYAMYRAMYQLNTYLDQNSGEQVVMSNFDAVSHIKNGESLIQVGHLSAQQVAAAQKFVSESVPAIKEVRLYLKAYDNEGDKLVFARVMDELGPPPAGEEVSWVGNVLDQALMHSELSPEARKLIPRLIRLKETVGSLRQSLGAPATDSSMALMLALIPGPSTPDAAYARDLIDQFEQNARNSVAVPILKPAVGGMTRKGGGPTPPPGGSDRPPLSQFEQHR